MEKIFKKSLALVLSAALCLTALVGCLTVSADETTKASYKLATDVTGKAGETVTVRATLSDLDNVCAHDVIFTIPSALKLEGVLKEDGNAYGKLDESSDDVSREWDYVEKTLDNGDVTVRFLDIINFKNEVTGNYDLEKKSMIVDLKVTIPTGAAADDTYTIGLAVTAATQAETLFTKDDFDLQDGLVTVVTDEPDEPVLDENIAFTRTLNLASDLSINFLVKTELMTGYDADSIYAVIYRDVYALKGTEPESPTSTPITVKAVLNGDKYQFKYTGLAAREMTAKVYCTVYGTKNGVLYRSNMYSSSIQDWCIAASASPKGTKEYAIAASLAWYGARAQEYTEYNLDNLADAGGMAEYIDRRIVADMQSYTDNKTIVANPNGSNCVEKWGRTLLLTDILGLNCKITLNAEYAAKYTDLKLRYSYTDDTNKVITGDVSLTKNGDVYQYVYYGLKSYEFDIPVSFTLYEGDTQISETYTTAVVDWCVAAYGQLTDAKPQGRLAAAIYSYCLAANSRFGS